MKNQGALPKGIMILALIIFGIGAVVLFYNGLDLYTSTPDGISTGVMLVLIFSLAINVIVTVYPKTISLQVSNPYSNSLIAAALAYAVIANLASVILVKMQVQGFWFAMSELLILAIALGSMAVFLSAGQKNENHNYDQRMEKASTMNITLQMTEIEAALSEHAHWADVNTSFLRLKERMRMSAPFGRVKNNAVVSDLEDKISANLEMLLTTLTSSDNEEGREKALKSLSEILVQVKNRERMSIQ